MIGFAALLFACRGAPLGTPVADDYCYLHALQFRPLDLFDSMGSPIYWRPLSRQAYFLATGPWMITAPWGIAALHAVLLAALFVLLYRSARHAISPSLAAMVAVFPIASEPARVLLSWPDGANHLLPAAFAAAALHETLYGRRWTAALAALAAALSHEAGILAFPLLPVVAWLRTGRTDETLRFGIAAATAGGVWTLGYALALGHGVALPRDAERPPLLAALPGLYARALAGWLNLEDLPAGARAGLLAGHGALLAAAMVAMTRRAARDRIAGRLPAIAGGLAWTAAGTTLLVLVLPDWNAWRAWVPSIGFGVAVTLLLGTALPALAPGFLLLRLVALLLAPAPPAVVAAEPPRTDSHFSFGRLTRLQLTVESTRRALQNGAPSLPRGAAVRFWSIPNAVRLGFQDSLAAQVWYRDTTLAWTAFGGQLGLTRRVDAMLEFFDSVRSPASLIEPAAIGAFQQGMLALHSNLVDRADSLFAAAENARAASRGTFLAAVVMKRAILAQDRGQMAVAESLRRRSLEMSR